MTHKQFAKTLVAWREQNDYTQQEAADRLGVSRRSLENWEQERAMPQGANTRGDPPTSADRRISLLESL